MNILAHCPPDTAAVTPPQRPKRSHRAVKPQLVTRAMLDQRTQAGRAFNQLASAIEQDLGGRSELSNIELGLIEAFTGANITLQRAQREVSAGRADRPWITRSRWGCHV